MKFFRFDIGARASKASRFIGGVQSELLKAVVEERLKGTSQQSLAQKLRIPRSELNNQLAGTSGLTLRAVSDLAWALDREINFELKARVEKTGQNHLPEASTLISNAPTMVGASTNSSTLPSRPQIRIVTPRIPAK
ncbi:XRE family transcriptional regulator [Bosea sp. NBC_00550]|uniref:XRE family transcriptional regulator n=1 Tax=Bosea sp. NBC_00550 TaxID=2969621 RepID=UPI00222EAAEF|nr:XRE family transcriptional regulator [Bosea sp. NBC_00550]UZF95780.1 XRE family transcriptional regulator [Bosea sp. NBC_00550]